MANSNEENISKLSVGYAGDSYYHCGLYIGDNRMIESICGGKVVISSIDSYNNSPKLVCRTSCDSEFIDDVIRFAHTFVGFEYNFLFLPKQKNKLYCSELIHRAFDMANGKIFFAPQKLNYISPDETEISNYWKDLYGQYGYEVPHGEEGSHPNNLSLDAKFVFRFYI
jgi:uncharacterized protein YycO